jgi:hypothetical protein
MPKKFHIETQLAPDVLRRPNRFRVNVRKHRLVVHYFTEFFRYRTRFRVIVHRPCIFTVYDRLVGGMAPREELCVGCLRCTTQNPELIKIRRNPKFMAQGDSYFRGDMVDTVNSEAQTGAIPVKGAGYKGRFGGEGWDGMWTDMSEIVRPTRDGIHGREYISTMVDIGGKPPFLTFDEHGRVAGDLPSTISVSLPILLDAPPPSVMSETIARVFAETARQCETLCLLPVADIISYRMRSEHIVPFVSPENTGLLDNMGYTPALVEMAAWDGELYQSIQSKFPSALICLRMSFGDRLVQKIIELRDKGISVFHLAADFHGRDENGGFIADLVREAHESLIEAGCRNEVTLLGSGGIVMAEHVAKAIICGLDAVALDTALLAALQVGFKGECRAASETCFTANKKLTFDWGVQRLKNLLAAWRNQMLEIAGAMGIREVRRMRGEMGRAMFQKELEREAFGDIKGYG